MTQCARIQTRDYQTENDGFPDEYAGLTVQLIDNIDNIDIYDQLRLTLGIDDLVADYADILEVNPPYPDIA